MQTETLQEFIVVAKYSNFRKAAEELHMSQSALSSHIAALEREIGVQLFDRNGNAHLTSAGAHFYACAQQILALCEKSVQETRNVAKQAHPVRLQLFGREDSVLEDCLTSIKTPFHVVGMDTKQTLFEALRTGEADVLAAPGVPTLLSRDEKLQQGEFCSFPIGKAKFSYLVSSSNPLAAKDSLTREDIRRTENLVTFGNLYDWFGVLSQAFYGEDLGGIDYVQDPSMPVGSDLVPLCDLGERIMPSYRGVAHHSCRNRSDLVSIDKVEGESFESMEYLAWRADNSNPNVQAFVDEVHALVGDVQDDRASAEAQTA